MMSGRAAAYRVREQQHMSIVQQQQQPSNRSSSTTVYQSSRPPSVYAANYSGGSQVVQYHPSSVITVQIYDPRHPLPPQPSAASVGNMADPPPTQQHLQASPRRRVAPTIGGLRDNSSRPVVARHHQMGTKKLGGGVVVGGGPGGGGGGGRVGGGKMVAQRTSSVSPTALGHYHTNNAAGYFSITAYLPHDGGKRLKLQCTPGMTVQQVIETEIPDISRTGYQVYHFPSRALLNPEKEAVVLQDQEICIEPMRRHNNGDVNDRLAIVKELLDSEDNYLESLRNIFDVYMEPLRKWSLPQADINVMFRSLSRLCDLLMNFFSELEIAVDSWDSRRTQIGGLFRQYPSFWDLYEEYGANYPRAIRLLKEKCRDEAFSSFLAMKRGAARHTLESLMLLPVQRIYEYHRLLVRLFSVTSKDHPDYEDLRHTVARVQHMVRSRENELTQTANETKLDQVQSRFPNDNLFLSDSIEAMEALTRRNKTSSPAGVGGGGGGGVSGRNQHKKSMNGMDQSEMIDSGTSMRRGNRTYIQEGPAKFLSGGDQSHERYLFLFDDILLVAKPTGKQRSQQRTFRLKHRVRLSDVWVVPQVEPILVAPLSPDLCLIIGWPVIHDCIVQFSSVDEKRLWTGLLDKWREVQMKMIRPDSLPITITDHTKSSNQSPEQMIVHCRERVDDVLARALEKMGNVMVQGGYQLLVKYTKDEAAIVLSGHENPYAIQSHHLRQTDGGAGGGGGGGGGESKPGSVEFYIKRKNPPPPVEPKGFRDNNRRTRASRIKDWYRGRGRKPRDGPVKKKKFRLFGAPLGHIFNNGQMPEILQEMLLRLYNEGPLTRGIFRITANYRKVKELKESIDSRQRVDISSEETSIHTVAALLKDLLRNVPGGILLSSRYTEFVATNDIKDTETRVHHIQRILQKLPQENVLFLKYLLPLLHRVTEEKEENGMNAINLAICFAPTLLWPDSGLDVIKNEVPPLIQFMVENSPRIFGNEVPSLYRMETGVLSPSPRTSYRVPTKKTDGNHRSFGHRRNPSLDTSTSEDSAGEDDIIPSNLQSMQQRGLTFSDSQVSVLSQQLEDEEYGGGVGGGDGGGRTANTSNVLVLLTSDHHHHRERFSNPPKRPKKSRPAERSSSYRGPNERPLYVQNYNVKMDDITRRKSIATQTTLQRGTSLHFPSPTPSSTSSSQLTPTPTNPSSMAPPRSQEIAISNFAKSRQMQSFDENEEYEEDELLDQAVRRRPGQKMKHGLPYRQAFSVDHLLQGPSTSSSSLTNPHSMSFYDHLPPLGVSESPSSGRHPPRNINLLSSHQEDSFETAMDEDEEWGETSLTPMGSGSGGETPLHRPILSSSNERSLHSTAHASNQSITSRSSGGSSGGGQYYTSSGTKLPQSRQSNMSLVSSISESSFASGGSSLVNKESSPEPEQRAPLNHEVIKYEITRRFHIPASRGNSFNSPHAGTATATTPTTRSDSFTQEMENIQRKFQERHRPETLQSVSTASSTTPHSEMEGLSSPQSVDDDRPESERHLHSLPRRSVQTDFIRSPPPPPSSSSSVPVQPPAPVVEPTPAPQPQPPPPPPPSSSSAQPGMYRRSRSAAMTERRRGSGGTSGQQQQQQQRQQQDTNRLSIDNNNSDTESSPSRTLNRRHPDEVVTRIVPVRYRGGQGGILRQPISVGHAILGGSSVSRVYSQASTVAATAGGAEISIIPAKKGEEKQQPPPLTRISSSSSASVAAAAKAALTQSLPLSSFSTSKPHPPPTAPQAQVPTTDSNILPNEEDLVPAIRPKSAEGSIDSQDDEPFRKRKMSDIEKSKLRLGLIAPRGRSKSISETKPGKPLGGGGSGGWEVDQDEEDEVEEEEEEEEEGERVVMSLSLSQGSALETISSSGGAGKDKNDRRGMWRAHAPSSIDRKEAYTQRMKSNLGSSVRGLIYHRGASSSKISSGGPAPPPPAIHRTATAPEMPTKRRATTMPEYLVTRSSGVNQRGRVLGRGLVRTVKITSYQIPEPQKIQRINLRTGH